MSSTLGCLKALADPTRLRLVRVLARHELSVTEVVRLLDMGQSRVSRHLAILAQSGILRARREGLRVYYRAVPDGSAGALITAVEAVAGSDREDLATTMRDLERAQSVVQERSATTRSFFDARAAEWDRLSREVLGDLDLPAQVGAILGLLRSRPESAVDIGCGTGTLLEVLAATAARSIGVDSSPRMLERARRRFEGRPEVEVRLGEAEHLPLGDGEAQLVLMSMTLHHLAEPEAGLREVARVTTRGGSLLIVELAPHDLEDLRDAQGDRWLGFDRGELLAMARGAGYELAEERSFDLPRGLGLATYLFRKTMNGGARNGQRKDLRGS